MPLNYTLNTKSNDIHCTAFCNKTRVGDAHSLACSRTIPIWGFNPLLDTRVSEGVLFLSGGVGGLYRVAVCRVLLPCGTKWIWDSINNIFIPKLRCIKIFCHILCKIGLCVLFPPLWNTASLDGHFASLWLVCKTENFIGYLDLHLCNSLQKIAVLMAKSILFGHSVDIGWASGCAQKMSSSFVLFLSLFCIWVKATQNIRPARRCIKEEDKRN